MELLNFFPPLTAHSSPGGGGEIEGQAFQLHETPDAVPASGEPNNEAFSVAWPLSEAEIEQDRSSREILPFWLGTPIIPSANLQASQWTLDFALPFNLEVATDKQEQAGLESVSLAADGTLLTASMQTQPAGDQPFPFLALRHAFAGIEQSPVELADLDCNDASARALDPGNKEEGENVFKLLLRISGETQQHDHASLAPRSEMGPIVNLSVPGRTIQDSQGLNDRDRNSGGVLSEIGTNAEQVEHFAQTVKSSSDSKPGGNDSGSRGADPLVHGLKQTTRPNGDLNLVASSAIFLSGPNGGEAQDVALGKSGEAGVNPVRYPQAGDMLPSQAPAGQPLRTLSFQLGGSGAGKVQVHLAERDGAISLSVRGTDPAMNRDLRLELDSLLTRLHDSGFSARVVEEFVPGYNSAEPGGRQQPRERHQLPNEGGGRQGDNPEDSNQKQGRRSTGGHAKESFSGLLGGIAPASFQLQPS